MIRDFIRKYKFDINADRLGPDCPFTHWKLFFSKSSYKLCKKKFGSFGDNSCVRPGVYAICCSKIHVGKNVTLRPNTMLFASPDDIKGEIIIEDNVLIGSGVHIYVSNHEFSIKDKDIIYQGHREAKKVVIKKGAWIGANAVILPGVTVGENAVIGAGSIVTKSMPSRTVSAGNPCRTVCKVNE